MTEPPIYYSTEPICGNCRRPRSKREDLTRWDNEYGGSHMVGGTPAEPLWARRLCWSSEGGCGVTADTARRRIAEGEYQRARLHIADDGTARKALEFLKSLNVGGDGGAISIRSEVEYSGVHEHGKR